MLQVHGRTPLTTYASQVPMRASSLNTNDCFVLIHPEGNWVWLGKGSTGDEREMAKRMATPDPDPTVVFEVQENSAIQQFWALLGGKTAYMDERVLKNVGETTVPRLFHGSNASGSFKSMFCITLTQGQS